MSRNALIRSLYQEYCDKRDASVVKSAERDQKQRQTRRASFPTLLLTMAAFTLIALGALFIFGCSDQQLTDWKAEQAALLQKRDVAMAQSNDLQDQITAMMGSGGAGATTQPAAQKLAATLQKVNTVVKEANAAIDSLAAKIAAAKTGEETIGSAIQTGGHEVAKYVPAPFNLAVELGSLLIGGIVAGIPAWRKGKSAGVVAGATAVSRPIEMNRMPVIEAELNEKHASTTGDEFVVFSKWDAAMGHDAGGVLDAVTAVGK